MTGARLAQLVGPHAVHGAVIGVLVVLDGDLGGHAAHGVDAALVAGLDEELDVGVHEGDGHGDGAAVGQDEVGVVAELLDGAEDVVPAAAVEPGAVVAQLVEDLVHLEGRQDRLDQHRAADRAPRHPHVVLRQVERVVPQPRLQVRLHLGQVEVRPEAVAHRLLRIVEEVQPEVEQRPRDGLPIHRHVALLEVPAPGPHDQRRQRPVGPQLVLLGPLLEVYLPSHRVVQVHLPVNHIIPCRGA